MRWTTENSVELSEELHEVSDRSNRDKSIVVVNQDYGNRKQRMRAGRDELLRKPLILKDKERSRRRGSGPEEKFVLTDKMRNRKNSKHMIRTQSGNAGTGDDNSVEEKRLEEKENSHRRIMRVATEKRSFQMALTELKVRVMKSARERNVDDDQHESVMQRQHREADQGWKLALRHCSDSSGSEKPLSTPKSHSVLNSWRPKHIRLQRSSNQFPSRTQIIEPNMTRSVGSRERCTRLQPPKKDQQKGSMFSIEEKPSFSVRAKNWKQMRRKNVPLRRTKSSSNLELHGDREKVLQTCSSTHQLKTESDLVRGVQTLRSSLDKSEAKLEEYLENSERAQAKIRREVERLSTLYSLLSHTQEIRYHSLLDVFHENYKLLGYVESNFEYVLSVASRERRSRLQRKCHSVMRFVADNMMAAVLYIVQVSSTAYLRLFPRKGR